MKICGVSKITIAVILFLHATANAVVWYVHLDSTLNCIQTALDNCSAHDTVLVGSGVYNENLIWPSTHGIDLVSENGSALTVVDGQYTGRVITISTVLDSTTRIKGFTIRHGQANVGGAIYCGCGSSPTIINNMIMQNRTAGWNASGGGIFCNFFSSPFIIENTITENRAVDLFYLNGHGGGVGWDIEMPSSPSIIGNTITNNVADKGGGIGGSWIIGLMDKRAGGVDLRQYASPTIDSNVIAYNTAKSGGGIYLLCDSSDISNNTISHNLADNDGGGIYCEYSKGRIRTNTIAHNIADAGSGIFCSWCSFEGYPRISRSSIRDNEASGICCADSSYPYIDSCTISNNGWGTSGGIGLYIEFASIPEIRYCNIYGHTGWGVYNSDTANFIDAENNWWGHPSGPSGQGAGIGDPVSQYVNYTPWLVDSVQWIGVGEQPIVKPVEKFLYHDATIFGGPLQLHEGKECRVFDITGRVVAPDKMQPGIYFIQVEGAVTQKVVKVR